MSLWHAPLVPTSTRRLVCLPHAGGGAASWRGWREALPCELVPVRLPARDGRRSEPMPASIPALVEALCAGLAAVFDRPVVLFGHSFGALLAFELARVLPPGAVARLVVSARRAPQLPVNDAPIHQLPDADFLDILQRRFGPLPRVLRERPELLRWFLPTLRADYRLLDSWVWRPGPPLGCPITAVGGKDDSRISLADLRAWQAQTHATCDAWQLPGGHFWFRDRPARAVEVLTPFASD